MPSTLRLSPIFAGLLLTACVTPLPSGPNILVLPGSGKNFDQFRYDDMMCRQFASDQLRGVTPELVASDSVARSAALGTVLGAVAGAAIDGSHGAAVGAGTGLLMGSASGAGAAQLSSYEVQQRYDFSYVQCMYSQGHRVPVAGRFSSDTAQARPFVPPPPPGKPPPPPPGLVR